MLYYAPQVILITDTALFRADKLYEVIEDIKTIEPKLMTFFSQFTNFRERLKAYLDSIPSDMLEELKMKTETVK